MSSYYCRKCKKNHHFHSKPGKDHIKYQVKNLPKKVITELKNKISRISDLLLSTIELNDLNFVLDFKRRVEEESE
ncbi:MAG: hypothetical protein ACXADW_24735 [Candidatus Hodarchaeales archaeon]|jgi:hypothetical protein